MSFYSFNNDGNACCCPGKIQGNSTQGLTERVCIQVKRVYDSCIQQEQFDNVPIELENIQPSNVSFTPPLTFISCRSLATAGKICDLCIERLEDRDNFARVRAIIQIPIEVLFVDSTGREGVGLTCIEVKKDVVLYVPCESIIPFTAESVASGICVNGTYQGNWNFTITVCITVILKIVAEVEMVMPSYGFCTIPPCEEYAAEICDQFFSLPIFPPEHC